MNPRQVQFLVINAVSGTCTAVGWILGHRLGLPDYLIEVFAFSTGIGFTGACWAHSKLYDKAGS